MTELLSNHLAGRWQAGHGAGTPLHDPVLGTELVRVDASGLDLRAGFDFARRTGGAALRALTKVVSVLPVTLRAQMDAFQEASTVAPRRNGPTVSTQTLTALSQACRDRLPARFGYSAGDGTQTHRDTEPHALVALDTRWYLVAFDRTRQDWRTFRVDRIGELSTSTLTFAARELPGGDALEYVRQNSRRIPRRYQLEVRLRSDPETIRRMLGSWGELTEERDGWCRWAAGVDELRWPTALLVAADCELEPLGPPELVESLARARAHLTPKAG